jgi:hypothetical protein
VNYEPRNVKFTRNVTASLPSFLTYLILCSSLKEQNAVSRKINDILSCSCPELTLEHPDVSYLTTKTMPEIGSSLLKPGFVTRVTNVLMCSVRDLWWESGTGARFSLWVISPPTLRNDLIRAATYKIGPVRQHVITKNLSLVGNWPLVRHLTELEVKQLTIIFIDHARALYRLIDSLNFQSIFRINHATICPPITVLHIQLFSCFIVQTKYSSFLLNIPISLFNQKTIPISHIRNRIWKVVN